MDRFESMSAFVAVVEAGGFSAASRRLGMPLASISRKVSELEETLGVQLLTRSTRKVTMTDSGQQFFAACRRILDDLSEAERAASGEYRAPRGELVMTAPLVFGRLHIVPIVTAFLKAYPDVDIQMRLVDRVVNLLEACGPRLAHRRAAGFEPRGDAHRQHRAGCLREPGVSRGARHAPASR
jgi:DNA-binding transcriptional LysR family regulator